MGRANPERGLSVLPGTRFTWTSSTQYSLPIDGIEVTVTGAIALKATRGEEPYRREDLLEATTAGIGTFVARAEPLSQSITVRVAALAHIKSVELREALSQTIDIETPWMKGNAAPSTIHPGRYGIVLTFDDGSIAVGGYDGLQRPIASAYAIEPCRAPKDTPLATIGCVQIWRAYRGRSPLTIRVGDAIAEYTVEVP